MKMKPLLVLAAVCAIGGGLYAYLHHTPKEEAKKPPAIAVNAMTLTAKPVELTEEYPGRATAHKVAEVRPQVNGIIFKRLFVEGSMVKKGQQLYQIDPAPYQAAYDSAKADLARAEALVKSTQAKSGRYKGLIKIEAISKQDYDDIVASAAQAQADVGIAKAAVATAKINLDYTKMYAPISGQISKSLVTEGALVNATQTTALAVITQLDPIFVDVTQASEDVQRLRRLLKDKKKQSIALLFQQGTDRYTHEGAVQFSDVTVDPSTGSVQMRALFPNPEGELLPGMFVRAQLTFTTDPRILVPQKATIRGADGNLTVWVIGEDQTVKPTAIMTERAVGDSWLVTSGVNDGDLIVIEGMQKLTPGATVTVTPPAEAAAPSEGK